MPSETYRQQRARKYLEQLAGMRDYLNALKAASVLAWELATNTTPNLTGDAIDHGGRISRAPENYVAVANQITSYETEMLKKQQEIMAIVHRIKGNTERAIITEHYVNGLTWNETALKVSYTCEHVKRIGKAALLQVYDFLPESDR